MVQKKLIKIYFTDFWPGLEKDNYFLRLLQKHFNVVVDANPDYLFFSVYGSSHLQYANCIKIFFTGENVVPDFNVCDYALGFNYLQFEDRYMRFPLYAIYPGYQQLTQKKVIDAQVLHRKFCNFVYSNNTYADPARTLFFNALSKYKKIDSGGRYLNNMGGPVADKMSFISQYKFSIAFENSVSPGYTTEKIMEPMVVNSMPVYYGNPLIHLDFNTDAFIQVSQTNPFEKSIEEIIKLDMDDNMYLAKLNLPWLQEDAAPARLEHEAVKFFTNIFQQPFNTAKRKTEHGFNLFKTGEQIQHAHLIQKHKKRNYFKTRIRSFFLR